MRLFIAIDLDAATRAAIAIEQKRLKAILREDTRSSIKWVSPDHMHMTLVFLGEVEEARAAALIDDVRWTSRTRPSTSCSAKSVCFLRAGRRMSLDRCGVAARNRRSRCSMSSRHGSRATMSALESRPFRPHLTLARWRGRDRRIASGRWRPPGMALPRCASITSRCTKAACRPRARRTPRWRVLTSVSTGPPSAAAPWRAGTAMLLAIIAAYLHRLDPVRADPDETCERRRFTSHRQRQSRGRQCRARVGCQGRRGRRVARHGQGRGRRHARASPSRAMPPRPRRRALRRSSVTSIRSGSDSAAAREWRPPAACSRS